MENNNTQTTDSQPTDESSSLISKEDDAMTKAKFRTIIMFAVVICITVVAILCSSLIPTPDVKLYCYDNSTTVDTELCTPFNETTHVSRKREIMKWTFMP